MRMNFLWGEMRLEETFYPSWAMKVVLVMGKIVTSLVKIPCNKS